jgi:UDP-glucuronate 4-epimerase
MRILITGAAGFIGFHLCKKLIAKQIEVIGLDNLNSYYDVNLKINRIKYLNNKSRDNKKIFTFIEGDLTNNDILLKIFDSQITCVINLAAQAGVRYSIENPDAYVQSNLVGFCNLIEISKKYNVKHFMYASSSSVYGGNKKLPFSESDNVDHPISLYAATKKSNELIAHTYSHLFKLPTTGLRFFTVYGPWGRPDMALFKFTDLIFHNKPIHVFNYGKMTRDFTYIDDVVESIFRLIDKAPSEENYNKNKVYNSSNSWAPYKIFNIGNSNPTNLNDYIKAIEKNLNKKADIILEEMQPGDVEKTYANTESLEKWIQFKPKTTIDDGIKSFISWYLSYYK